MSKIVYCIAQFTPKKGKLEELFSILKALEPNTLREDGCLSYRVTKHFKNEFAQGDTMPLVFNESWKDFDSFKKHCQRDEIVNFFESQCLSEDGLVATYNVTTYTDE